MRIVPGLLLEFIGEFRTFYNTDLDLIQRTVDQGRYDGNVQWVAPKHCILSYCFGFAR